MIILRIGHSLSLNLGLVFLGAIFFAVNPQLSVADELVAQTPVKKSSVTKESSSNSKKEPAQNNPAHLNLTTAYNAYLAELRSKVINSWNLPDGKNHVVVSVVVQPDGTVGEITFESTPKNETAEHAAHAAFVDAQPFKALPNNSPPMKLSFTFDSTADPHGDSTSSVSARLDPIKETATPASTK